jgi:hypothetical protein
MSLAEEVLYVQLTRLLPDPDNVNVHGEANISQIAASIEKFGFVDPIGVVAHEDEGFYLIVEGHGRFDAAQLLGLSEVPIIVLSMTDAQRRGYSLAHNQIQQITTMDMSAVAGEFQRLEVGADDYTALGFTDEDVLFLPSVADNFSAPNGGDYEERADKKADAGGADIGADSKAWAAYVPTVHRTSLRFASDVSYNRFTQLLGYLRAKHPTSGTISERIVLLLKELGFEGEPESADAS